MSSTEICNICMTSARVNGDEIAAISPCGHEVCLLCLQTWLCKDKDHGLCPACAKDADGVLTDGEHTQGFSPAKPSSETGSDSNLHEWTFIEDARTKSTEDLVSTPVLSREDELARSRERLDREFAQTLARNELEEKVVGPMLEKRETRKRVGWGWGWAILSASVVTALVLGFEKWDGKGAGADKDDGAAEQSATRRVPK